MIQSKDDLRYYLEQDRIALMKEGRPKLFRDEIWRFQIVLRKLEYMQNCCHSFWQRPLLLYYKFRFHKDSIKLGLSIMPNVFEEGLAIMHYGSIVVNGNAKVGKNCRVLECVNIGATGGSPKAPVVGDNVFIGTGAKLIGDITIADNIAVGAGSVVVHSFTEPGITIAGVPARKISSHGSAPFLSAGLNVADVKGKKEF